MSLFELKTNLFYQNEPSDLLGPRSGQGLFLPELLMIEVIATVTVVLFVSEGEKHDNSYTPLSRRVGEKKNCLRRAGNFGADGHLARTGFEKVPYSAQFQIFIFIPGSREAAPHT